jgi:hypothetical protein
MRSNIKIKTNIKMSKNIISFQFSKILILKYDMLLSLSFFVSVVNQNGGKEYKNKYIHWFR